MGEGGSSETGEQPPWQRCVVQTQALGAAVLSLNVASTTDWLVTLGLFLNLCAVAAAPVK